MGSKEDLFSGGSFGLTTHRKEATSQSRLPAGNGGTDRDAAASTRPTGKGRFNGGKFCVVPVGGTGLGSDAGACKTGSWELTFEGDDPRDQQQRGQVEAANGLSGTHT